MAVTGIVRPLLSAILSTCSAAAVSDGIDSRIPLGARGVGTYHAAPVERVCERAATPRVERGPRRRAYVLALPYQGGKTTEV